MAASTDEMTAFPDDFIRKCVALLGSQENELYSSGDLVGVMVENLMGGASPGGSLREWFHTLSDSRAWGILRERGFGSDREKVGESPKTVGLSQRSLLDGNVRINRIPENRLGSTK